MPADRALPDLQRDLIGFRARLENIQFNAVIAFDRFEAGTFVVNSVQISQVRRIRCILHSLEPIAVIGFARIAVSSLDDPIAVLNQNVVSRQRRGALFIPSHVSEDEPA